MTRLAALAGCDDDSSSPPAPPPAPSIATTALEFYASDGEAIVTWAGVAGVTAANYTGLPGGTRVTGASSTVRLTGLVNVTLYYLVVTAVNAGGEGPASAEISFMPQAQAAMPDFLLTDENPNSSAYNAAVSPTQCLTLVPGFYFGHST